MDPPGFEPGASALQGRRSPSLSYGPTLNAGTIHLMVDMIWCLAAQNKKLCLPSLFFMFKEVIQPQVPLRLPCYDFALLKEPRFDPNQ